MNEDKQTSKAKPIRHDGVFTFNSDQAQNMASDFIFGLPDIQKSEIDPSSLKLIARHRQMMRRATGHYKKMVSEVRYPTSYGQPMILWGNGNNSFFTKCMGLIRNFDHVVIAIDCAWINGKIGIKDRSKMIKKFEGTMYKVLKKLTQRQRPNQNERNSNKNS